MRVCIWGVSISLCVDLLRRCFGGDRSNIDVRRFNLLYITQNNYIDEEEHVIFRSIQIAMGLTIGRGNIDMVYMV